MNFTVGGDAVVLHTAGFNGHSLGLSCMVSAMSAIMLHTVRPGPRPRRDRGQHL